MVHFMCGHSFNLRSLGECLGFLVCFVFISFSKSYSMREGPWCTSCVVTA